MTITHGYTTLAKLKAEVLDQNITATTFDARMEDAIKAASRQIDGYCGRRFWQDTTVVARTYEPNETRCVDVDDISTTTGLVVKVDLDGDGTFETTIPSSDYRLEPRNAAAEYPVRPYTEIEIAPLSSYYFPTGLEATVEITAKFGWPAVPEDVEKACLVQATMLYKANAAALGVVELAGVGGVMRASASMHPMARALLDRYVKVYV